MFSHKQVNPKASLNIKALFNKSNLNRIHYNKVKVLDCKTSVPSNFHFKHLKLITLSPDPLQVSWLFLPRR